MKKILLSIFILTAAPAMAQLDIPLYNGLAQTSGEPDGITRRTYFVLSASTPLDESASGADATWNFTGLSEIAIAVYENSVPTPAETAEYPNTTMTVTQTTSGGTAETSSKIYLSEIGGLTSVTGLSGEGLSLNYSTNNAAIGQFPLSYGETLTDPVAGTYVFDTYSGNFTGSITTTYDGYGSFITDFIEVEETVYRITTVQNLTMSYLIFPDAGTVMQTIHYYYREGDLFPYFRSVTTNISVPLLGINETQAAIEHAVPAILSSEDFEKTEIVIAPNPVKDFVEISGSHPITKISIVDANGRTLIESANSTVDMSALPSGVYFATIFTSNAKLTRRLVKQ